MKIIEKLRDIEAINKLIISFSFNLRKYLEFHKNPNKRLETVNKKTIK